MPTVLYPPAAVTLGKDTGKTRSYLYDMRLTVERFGGLCGVLCLLLIGEFALMVGRGLVSRYMGYPLPGDHAASILNPVDTAEDPVEMVGHRLSTVRVHQVTRIADPMSFCCSPEMLESLSASFPQPSEFLTTRGREARGISRFTVGICVALQVRCNSYSDTMRMIVSHVLHEPFVSLRRLSMEIDADGVSVIASPGSSQSHMRRTDMTLNVARISMAISLSLLVVTLR
jgi:hypothetical protein